MRQKKNTDYSAQESRKTKTKAKQQKTLSISLKADPTGISSKYCLFMIWKKAS